MFKLDLEKVEEPEIISPTSLDHYKAREFQKNICFIDYAKVFVEHNKLWKILKEMDYQTTLPASWEIKKQQLELDIEQLTASTLGKEYIKVYIVNLFNLYAEHIM